MPRLHNETPKAQNKRPNARATKADRELLAAEYEAADCLGCASWVRIARFPSLTFMDRFGLRALAKQRIKHTAELANERALVAELVEALEYARLSLGDPVPIGRRHVARRIDAALKQANGKGL